MDSWLLRLKVRQVGATSETKLKLPAKFLGHWSRSGALPKPAEAISSLKSPSGGAFGIKAYQGFLAAEEVDRNPRLLGPGIQELP